MISMITTTAAPLFRRAVFQQTRLSFRNNNMSTTAASASDIISSLSSSTPLVGTDIELAVTSLANADAVCFDVDSTVIQEEGIDVLADFLGKGEEVSALTKQAMEGNTKFEDALRQRLDLLRPSKADIESCLQKHPLQKSPGVTDFIASLQKSGKDVFLVSGGFRIMIEGLANDLHISKKNIYANTILFDKEGMYTGFDDSEFTSADMGKPKAVKYLETTFGYDTIVMIGDGATDAQAKPPAKAFIGYGGVVERSAVKEKADWFVTDFDSLTHVVDKFAVNNKKK
mmetsp:Transcript_18357/g.20439  ORF Transcript_18357/g.20439 Transcript_18357/m.20439 type:complete len:285 (+) Transcript_18357:115-969(+)